MRIPKYILLLFSMMILGSLNCKEVYQPTAIQNNPNLLVIDGIIISGTDSSVITLSRTRSVSSLEPSEKVTNALVSVVGQSGVEYGFTNENNGRYIANGLLLDTTQLYQLKILTTDGNEFRSDLSNVRTSPPIDSVYWIRDSAFNVHIYLNTHDLSNNTRYYRWEYVETWEYRSAYLSFLQLVNDVIEFRPLDQQIYSCYQTQPSSNIDVANTSRLSSDIVNKFEINNIPNGSEKISEEYSNLVKQYAITPEAFDFWQNLKKNTEQLGSLFDLQPFTELGNIRCVNDPTVKCIGYISFTTLQQQRIFISKNQVYPWNYDPYYGECVMDTINPQYLTTFFPPGGPYFNTLIGTDNGAILFSSNLCVDCLYHGGTTIKPPYWP